MTIQNLKFLLPASVFEIVNPLECNTIPACIEKIAWFLFQVAIPVATIMILYSAFLYMTSGGSEEKITRARQSLTYALVGLMILFLAWGLTSLVQELLGV